MAGELVQKARVILLLPNPWTMTHNRVTRREALAGAVGVTIGAVAGCLGSDERPDNVVLTL